MVIDEINHRGYVIDRDHKRIEVYDVARDDFALVTTLVAGIDTPVSLAIDASTHRLYVGEGVRNKVSVIDIDPASTTEYTVLQSIATGGSFPSTIAVDDADTIFVANRESNDVSIITTTDASHVLVPVGRRPTDLVVDRAAHVAYASSRLDSSVTIVRDDGAVSNAPLAVSPVRLEFADGKLLIATEYPAGSSIKAHIESFDSGSWERVAKSPDLSSVPTDLAVSPTGEVYVVYPSSAPSSIQILKVETLESEGAVDSGLDYSGVTVEMGTDRLFVSENYNVGGAKVQMYESPTIGRLGGADRFAVSAAISQSTFTPGVPVAFVASGSAFADALSGSAAAGKRGGPVLLAAKDNLPPVISAELIRLRPAKIVVLGGTATLANSVQTALTAYAPVVERIAGDDRYALSASVSAQIFTAGVPIAYIASGAVFSDALPGSAASGHEGGPVLLATKDAVPDAVAAELSRLQPGRIVVLGGTNTIADSVVAALQDTAPTVRIAGADRYAVSAAVSGAVFPAGTRVVYVASGAVFADALSGSAAAIARKGPVLLVTASAIPPAVARELTRLAPTKIIVLGGANTVADSVLRGLTAFLRD
ncbi:cell wall-binding repeat-containing protein [Herbiconiux sp. CPCC 205763]|uniref:Cell wall-binding repeat-containing protein n=1 Tax=Herbiconiux aconitum TaxID=2970913 RepID=A0ABT2GUE9_9MICO|nr:cell wall-binding repeat-containing protein [Herbiconiux aconitum]MCS5719829.1 cell wall-binding repeat-containing protein [Herbiconiux aconitum]